MMRDTDFELYSKVIKTWGEGPQLLMVIEEMAELTKEICKTFRGEDNIEQLCEETADVLIMLEQLQIIFADPIKVYDYKQKKLTRLKERLEKSEVKHV
jgi:NTP pyrophosphatase (non-canonical NTP hydrolase)